MKITTILPVSRIQYLDRVLESLLKQKIESLVVVFDGPEDEFVQVRNRIAELDIENRVCVAAPPKPPAHTIAERRRHIVNIHNQIREIVGDCDWIFSVEDDGILPDGALRELIKVAKKHKNAGMITGVELGRWGLSYVGAWTADDVFEPTLVTSLENKTSGKTIEEIDGCGLYCALIRADEYKKHQFTASNGLGPDVNLGLYLRQQGYQNYINWGIHVTHLTNRMNYEMEIPATDYSKVVKLRRARNGTWLQESA